MLAPRSTPHALIVAVDSAWSPGSGNLRLELASVGRAYHAGQQAAWGGGCGSRRGVGQFFQEAFLDVGSGTHNPSPVLSDRGKTPGPAAGQAAVCAAWVGSGDGGAEVQAEV
jgi:hypothetical protein